jgi:hypothetical protein
MVSKKKNSNLKSKIKKIYKKTYKNHNKLDGGGFFSTIKGYTQLGVAETKSSVAAAELSVQKFKVASTGARKGILGKTFGLKKTKIMEQDGKIISKTWNRGERGKNFIKSNYKSTSQITQNVKYMKARLQTKKKKLIKLENRLGHEINKFETKYSKKLIKYENELTTGIENKQKALIKKYGGNTEKVDTLLEKYKNNVKKRHAIKMKKLDLRQKTFKKKVSFLNTFLMSEKAKHCLSRVLFLI